MGALKLNKNLTIEEHIQIAKHFYSIKEHIHKIMKITNGKLLAKYADILCANYNGFGKGLGEVRSQLDNDWFRINRNENYATYYNEDKTGTACNFGDKNGN